MARTIEQILRDMIGQQGFAIAGLQAECEKLQERVKELEPKEDKATKPSRVA